MNKYEAPVFVKKQGERLDYKIDMSRELVDTISSVIWLLPDATSDPRDLAKVDATFDAKTATIWLKGGKVGKTYNVVAVMQTTGGRTYEPYFKLNITPS
jgi:hypothetical protein